MTATADTISGYFDMIKWAYRAISPTKVVTSYRCPVTAYYYVVGIEVTTGEHWITVRALLQRDVGGAQLDAVLQLISQWNTVSYRARFLLVDDCVVVQAEIPKVQLSLDEFLFALSAVCRYSVLAGVEIAAVATNPSLCAKFNEVVEATRTPTWDQSSALADLDLDFDITLNQLPD